MCPGSHGYLRRPQNWGYSHKIGPVWLSDREDTISPKKKDEIEDEVRRYVICLHAVSVRLAPGVVLAPLASMHAHDVGRTFVLPVPVGPPEPARL